MVSSGNFSRHGWLVAGLMLAGPVEPLQEPSEFTHNTKCRSVSIGLPAPIMVSHQPGSGSRTEDAAWAPGDRPVNSRIALDLSSFSVPQLSQASCTPGRLEPR